MLQIRVKRVAGGNYKRAKLYIDHKLLLFSISNPAIMNQTLSVDVCT